jgi:hypothetical protein
MRKQRAELKGAARSNKAAGDDENDGEGVRGGDVGGRGGILYITGLVSTAAVHMQSARISNRGSSKRAPQYIQDVIPNQSQAAP